uniref:Uncharacterized protein n=1 Tax=Ditylenchus dipsaci TaxID=166011 RepID=A0A915D9Y6_9BILA
MSFEAAKFEAVPCVFKGRAEDGNEASLFGLLIRPSSSQQQPQISTTSSSSTTSTLVPVPTPSGSAIQIVPNPNVAVSKPAIAPSSGRSYRASRHTPTCKPSSNTHTTAIPSSASQISISPRVAGPSRPNHYPAPPTHLVQIQPQWANPSTTGTSTSNHASTSTQMAYPLQPHHFEINAGHIPSGRTRMVMNNHCKAGFESPSPSQVVPQLLDP